MKKIVALFLVMLLALLPLGGCGGNKNNEIIMYDGITTEMQLVHRMVKLLVEEHTDAKVTIKDQMSGVNMFKEMTKENPSCDMMNTYDGTVLTTFLKMDPKDVPAGQTLYEYANAQVNEKHKVSMMDKIGIDSTYAVAVPQTIADKYNLKTVSDLIPVAPELTFGAEHEFFTEEGTMKFGPFTKFYGLNFKDSKSVDIGLKYSAIENGNFDVTEVYTTDGLNRKVGLKVLEDDKKFFPEYNGALLVRDDLFDRLKDAAPNLKEVFNMLGGKFTNESMTDLTYAVDVEGKSLDNVAKDFLKSQNMIK